MSGCRVYIGNLPIDVKEREIDDLFYKFGRIRDIAIVARDPPAFAFVEYSHPDDADEAVRRRDNYTFDGKRLRCEIAKDKRDRDGDRDRDRDRGRDRDRDRGGRDRPSAGGRERGERKPREPRIPPTRAEHGVVVGNLPKDTKWKELKELFKEQGSLEAVFADISKDSGEAVLEFSNPEDLQSAMEKFNEYSFKNKIGLESKLSVRIRETQAPATLAAADAQVEAPNEVKTESDVMPSAAEDSNGDRRDRSRSRDRKDDSN